MYRSVGALCFRRCYNQFAFDFLHEKHVMIIPGRGFSWNKPDHFRIVMLPEPEKMADAMERLRDFLSTYRQNA